MKLKLLLICAMAAASVSGYADVTPVVNSKAKGRILTDGSSQADDAARLMQKFVKEITQAELPIAGLERSKPRRNDIVMRTDSLTDIPEDGFDITTDRGIITVVSGCDNGVVYGAVTLLEDYLGVDCFGAGEYRFTPTSTISLPDINRRERPAFRYRQSQSYALREDSIYRLWMRLEEPRDEFAASMWVHTFDRLLPSAVYGESHPEYYSWLNGQRRPGKASQWCLSNPEVFSIVAARIDSIFEANPGKNIISVSQNDGNNTFCTCPECQAVNEAEGSPSGAYIRFLNKLAARRPDKQFSTLAYLFTMHPPRLTKPLPNVNIMLCDIDAKREVPLTDNASGRDFVKALRGWSRISPNIFVWDYGINFDNYLAPFPNFPILQPNMKLFRDNNVKMHFSQIAGSRGGDFTEMRTWIVSKLMWNPEADVDSLMRHFMDGYYGPAAPYLYEYEKLLEGALLATGRDLWIYDSPVSHKDGMLNAPLRRRYNTLFDRAEAAVASDSLLLARVQRQRLTLQYSELEIARAEGHTADPSIAPLLLLFEERVKRFDIPTLNERNNSPVDYCQLYKERYLSAPDSLNLARNATISWITPPTGRYATGADKALIDGIYGGTSFVESWVGWEGTDPQFVIDLGKEEKISSVTVDCLHQLGQWVFFPSRMEVTVSSDATNYTPFATVDHPADRDPRVKFAHITATSTEPVSARYIRLHINGVPVCPSWHYGVGSPGWVFIDEVIVNR